MSTRAFASAIIPAPIDQVWAVLRDFTSPAKLFKTVESVKMEGDAASTQVGAVRVVKFANVEVVKRQQLLELSDLHYRIVWETSPTESVSEVAAHITTVQLYRVTENNSTYVSWAADFSSDAIGKFVVQEQADYAANLADVKAFFQK
uniref:Bet v I/Major latex protein domain-containing protein n=1 Tax=Arcella intermedia TaxID=1963864 RepID=A0A6B2LPU6_9EUKA|eukprot:TRINITY_DN28192_c0_g1_i1.p1 TRINITY_DN28192_c0_g1~~TRINITY_DN28192_c0_g1_i1.p1  ORF type:complete len:147 (+),score=28.74 TRINITY_DN28192_c0_g1_i1:65-505(+)